MLFRFSLISYLAALIGTVPIILDGSVVMARTVMTWNTQETSQSSRNSWQDTITLIGQQDVEISAIQNAAQLSTELPEVKLLGFHSDRKVAEYSYTDPNDPRKTQYYIYSTLTGLGSNHEYLAIVLKGQKAKSAHFIAAPSATQMPIIGVEVDDMYYFSVDDNAPETPTKQKETKVTNTEATDRSTQKDSKDSKRSPSKESEQSSNKDQKPAPGDTQKSDAQGDQPQADQPENLAEVSLQAVQKYMTEQDKAAKWAILGSFQVDVGGTLPTGWSQGWLERLQKPAAATYVAKTGDTQKTLDYMFTSYDLANPEGQVKSQVKDTKAGEFPYVHFPVLYDDEAGSVKQATQKPASTPAPSEQPAPTPAPSEQPASTPAPTEQPASTPAPSEQPASTPKLQAPPIGGDAKGMPQSEVSPPPPPPPTAPVPKRTNAPPVNSPPSPLKTPPSPLKTPPSPLQGEAPPANAPGPSSTQTPPTEQPPGIEQANQPQRNPGPRRRSWKSFLGSAFGMILDIIF